MRIGLGRPQTNPWLRSACSTRLISPLHRPPRSSPQAPCCTQRVFQKPLVGTTRLVSQLSLRNGGDGAGRQGEGLAAEHDHGSKAETKRSSIRPPVQDRQNADAWMILLDPYLPQHLRITTPDEHSRTQTEEHTRRRLLLILNRAREAQHAGTNLLVHMGIRHGRWKAVRWLVDLLLKHVAGRAADHTPPMTPSNIAWPIAVSLHETCNKPITVEALSYPLQAALHDGPGGQHDPRYAATLSEGSDTSMTLIWTTLGTLIIEAADMPAEQATTVMTTVYQIIAQIHSADLVPDHVYSYVVSNHSSAVQRPPILHLLSSRILTTASDAVWRSHQDDLIHQVSSLGEDYRRDVTQHPPGGRFRLKVRPLGPEAWLEFVLWCCVDGGFAQAGIQIVHLLRMQVQKPWYAATWSSVHDGGASPTPVDWDRVKLRYGGTVGQIEGYSKERPFVEMEPRTISTEVVLALVETAANTVRVGPMDRGVGILETQQSIKDLLTFLEPHGLPHEYLDYLTIRLMETGGFTAGNHAVSLRTWAQTMSYLRTLERVSPSKSIPPTLSYDAILQQSELPAGLLHASLDGFVEIGDVREAVDVFNDIQKLVDGSKLQSIHAFLREPPASSVSVEFVHSHGQIPYHKLAALFALATESRLVVLCRWLLYSDEVDGPLIPRSAYGLACMSAVVAQFAAMSEDGHLLRTMIQSRRGSTLKPSVRLLRSVANAYITTFDFARAEDMLAQTLEAQAGGYAPSNFAHLAAAFLILESPTVSVTADDAARKLDEAASLMEKMLAREFDGSRGDFRTAQVSTFRRQIYCLIRVLRNTDHTALRGLQRHWKDSFEPSNDLGLATSTFNVLLAAIVQTKGAVRGQKLWMKFCADPRPRSVRDATQMVGDDAIDKTRLLGDDWDTLSTSKALDSSLAPSADFIPFHPGPADDMHERTTTSEASPPGSRESPPFAPGISFTAPDFDTHADVDDKLDGDDDAVESLEKKQEKQEKQAWRHPDPVVVPDRRTLRIIVRAALIEIRQLQQQGRSTQRHQRLLRWAVPIYGAFGMKYHDIEQEIQQRLAEDDEQADGDMSVENEEDRPDVSRGFHQPGTLTRLPSIRRVESSRRQPV